MTTSAADLEKGTLRIGDYVLLKDTQRNAYLSAEGILLEDINATEGTNNLVDCLFCVHLQRQYSASRDLQAFLNIYGNDAKKIEDESAKKYYLALQRGRENEKKLNDTYMRKKYGQKLSFGDIMQLFHVKSGKYLAVVPDKLAKDERENTRIALDGNGNSYSWLQLAPRFKIDKEGDRVLSNAEVYLKVAERANEFIHTADRDPYPGRPREVNCALESSPWKLSIYQSSVDALDNSLLLASQLIFLSDPESRCNLSIARMTLESFEDEEITEKQKLRLQENTNHNNSHTTGGESTTNPNSSNGKILVRKFDGNEIEDDAQSIRSASLSHHNNNNNNNSYNREGSGYGKKRSGTSSNKTVKPEEVNLDESSLDNLDATLIDSDNENNSEHNDGDDADQDNHTMSTFDESEYFHPTGDIILEPASDNDVFNSNFLWLITCTSLTNGGAIGWKQELIRLRHVNTGKYLYFMSITNDDEELNEQYIYTTTNEPSRAGTLFQITELNSTNKYLSNGKGIQLSQHGIYLERGEILEDSIFGYAVGGTKDKGNAVSLIINRYDGIQKNMTTADLNDILNEPLDVWSGLSIRQYLYFYGNMIVIPKHDSIGTIWPTAMKSDIEFFQYIADKMIYFCQGFPISSVNIQLGIDKGSNRLQKIRQQLVKEQDSLEQVLRMIYKLIPMTERLEQIKAEKNNRKRKKPSEEEMNALSMAQIILTKLFEIIFYAILDHPENQMYVADFMPVLLAHLNSQPLAGKCVTEMLSKNMELQETKIGTREIKIFVDKLRSSKMNAMYLQLLQACCSCEGSGVDNNQGKVADLLFSNTNDIIIQMNNDYVRTKQVTWQRPSLYIPEQQVAGSPIRGEILITKGLPQLSLAWTTNSIDFSPLGLFGRLSVNVEELFPINDLGSPDNNTNDNTAGNNNNKSAKRVVKASNNKSPQNNNNPNTKTNNGGMGGSAKNTLKKKSNLDQKIAVANYFIGEMFLGAEMCLDRNYIAMHKFDELFSYETLVSIIKMEVSNRLKGGAVRLLMCLHIDRDPQAASKIPCLTRTWSDIKKNTEPQLPYVEPARRYTFGLIQQMISEHIHGMAGSKWDDLSQHMLRLLRTLVQFNFYGTNERLQDVIVPLIAALDRRNVMGMDGEEEEGIESNAIEGGMMPNSPRKGNNNNENVLEEKVPVGTDYLDASNTNKHIDGDNDDDQSVVSKVVKGIGYLFTVVYNINKTAARALLDDDNNTSKGTGYIPPLRYSKTPIYELETMVEAVDILAFAQKVIEDRNISLFLRYFYGWESGTDLRTPSELFEQVVNDSKQLSLSTAAFDNVMIDTLMFVHTPLVQSSLEVLMAHHSMRRILLDNAKNIQLLASHKRERQFRMVDQMLQQLEQNAETQELWGELATDADHAVNKQTKDILKELTDLCKIKRYVLEYNEEYMNDIELQDLLRNLGCFEICMKVMGLLDSVEEDENGELGEIAINTKNICLLCNQFLYWFFLDNPKNQELGFEELDFFLDTLDEEIDSHLVIHSIFHNNESLMRQVPHALLANLVDRIVKNGKSHFYLCLFSVISHVGDKNIAENQFEIVKSLTSPGRLQKIGCFMVPVNHPDYALKRELMEPYVNTNQDVDLDDLPPLLAYHLLFLDVLSGCTVGRMNVTAVEAKVQAVFSFVDIIESIMDGGTMLYAKILFTKFLFNAVIDVELLIPGFEKTPIIWRLLETYEAVVVEGYAELLKAHEHGWDRAFVHRQKVEYMMMCIRVVGGFFSSYFDVESFKVDSGTASIGAPASKQARGTVNSRITITHIFQLIVGLFHSIHAVYELNSPRLSLEMKTLLYNALATLKGQGSKYIRSPLFRQEVLDMTASSSMIHMNPQGGEQQTEDDRRIDNIQITDRYINPDSSQAVVLSLEHGSGPKLKDPTEIKLIEKYHQFMAALDIDTTIQYKADNENVAFISILEKLPFIADPVEADVRFESLLKKLVSHIRENIKIVNNQKRMDSRVTKTSTWIIRAFRTMIENRMGMSIYERDEEGGLEQDVAAAPVVNALNQCGATALCLDLIADGIEEKLQLEAIKLGVALLFKEGGALEVQEIMHTHLTTTDSELFFKQVRLTLQQLQAWHVWNHIIILPAGESPKPPDEILIVRFLQLMCEGHYLPNQDIMREQLHNHVSFNLLDDFVNYLNALSRILCRTSTNAAIRLTATILEVIQGPCEGNQIHFALNTELVETCNRLNRAKLINDCAAEEEIDLKKTVIDIFQGLLEGQGERSLVYERVLSVIHLDIIQIMSKKSLYPGLEESEEQIILQTECIVLLQMLCNFRPALYDELGISRNVKDIVGSGTAMIEVIWRGDIHRRFFHVPKICEYLAKASKDQLVENVDRGSAENKLIDFLQRSYVLYREVKHQQFLTEMGLSRIISRANLNRATWFTFVLTIVINAIYIATYELVNGQPAISDLYNNVANYLNAIQLAVSSFTLILWIVLKSPVQYRTFEAQGFSLWETWFYTFTEPLTLYYTYYVILACLGLFVQNYYCALLLLDIIVKDSTTRDVLNSIVSPRKQLIMAFILIVFVVYIFSFFVFIFYRADIDPYCDTLWLCFKFCASYGFQNGGGIADTFSHATGLRLILDLAFFMIVLIVLLNVFLGMIIDTFSSLRAEKMEQLRDTLEVCFICNIEKQIFDRASDESDGFRTHVQIDHNMWNYLYFIILLWEQDRDDDDGLEQFVRRAIDAEDIAWFPINKAMRLENIATTAEILRSDLTNQIQSTQSTMTSKVDEFQSDVSVMLKQLLSTLKQEHPQGNDPSNDFLRRSMVLTPSVAGLGGLSGRISTNKEEEDNTLLPQTVSTGSVDNCLVKELWICIEKIDGLEIKSHVVEGMMMSLCCRILVDNTIHSVTAIKIDEDEDIITFPPNEFISLMHNILNLHAIEKRQLHIQLLLERGPARINSANANSSSNSILSGGSQISTQSSKLIGFLEIPILDLLHGHLPPNIGNNSSRIQSGHRSHPHSASSPHHSASATPRVSSAHHMVTHHHLPPRSKSHHDHPTSPPPASTSAGEHPTKEDDNDHTAPGYHSHHLHHHGTAHTTTGGTPPHTASGTHHSHHHHHNSSNRPPSSSLSGTSSKHLPPVLISSTNVTPTTSSNNNNNMVTTALVRKLVRPDLTEVCNIHFTLRCLLPTPGSSNNTNGLTSVKFGRSRSNSLAVAAVHHTR